MRFFVNGRFDVRPLAAEDKAHTPLPYDLISFLGGNPEDIAPVATKSTDFTDTNWGVGLDFYPMFITIEVFHDAEIMGALTEGFLIQIREHPPTGSDVAFFKKSYNSLNCPALLQIPDDEYIAAVTENIYGNKINQANTLRVNFTNRLDVIILSGKIKYEVSGIVI